MVGELVEISCERKAQRPDTQYNDIHNNDNKKNGPIHDTQYNDIQHNSIECRYVLLLLFY